MGDGLRAEQSSREIATHVREVIEAGPDGPRDVFDTLALDLFAYQYERNEPYRSYCDAAGISPAKVSAWSEIPAYPTQAFKDEIVTSFSMDRAVMAQLTSGTTSANQRGRIFRDELGQELIFAANRVMTGAYVFPDFGSGRRCRILILAPSPQMAPSMGMAIGMEQTRLHFGSPESAFLLGKSGNDGGFEIIGRARVVDGQVSGLPSDRTVGPMGDKKVFRLLEAYVNFSIDFKMGRFASKKGQGLR